MFTVLCEQYQPSLRRDPMYNEVSGVGAAAGQREQSSAPGGPREWDGALRGGAGGLVHGACSGSTVTPCPPLPVPRQDRTALLRRAAQADVVLRGLAR